MNKTLLGAFTALSLFAATPSYAYYDVRDYPEFIEIQANQSAFAIPVVGDTKSTQTNFGSKSFLDAAKVATKRFQIPHTIIRNPAWSADYYVPSVKLILVDRTPYMREWVDAADRGTSTKKQGFLFQSKEGINMGVGVSIAAVIKEEDAATFLYWFGTRSGAVSADPAVTFASVSYGKSLEEIMDTVVRGYVQAELSQKFMSHSFIEGNATAAQLMEEVRGDVTKHFAEKGITIDYIGYSGPLDYSNDIQKSIDETFISSMRAQSSANMMPAIPFMNAQAEVNIKNAEAQAITKWNGNVPMPSTVVGSDFINTLLGYVGFGSTKTASK
jgi:hypothetical protein